MRALSTSDLERYDLHFEIVLRAIKLHDLEQLDKFFHYYDLNQNHPLRILINRLVEPLPETIPNSDNTDHENVLIYEEYPPIIHRDF